MTELVIHLHSIHQTFHFENRFGDFTNFYLYHDQLYFIDLNLGIDELGLRQTCLYVRICMCTKVLTCAYMCNLLDSRWKDVNLIISMFLGVAYVSGIYNLSSFSSRITSRRSSVRPHISKCEYDHKLKEMTHK